MRVEYITTPFTATPLLTPSAFELSTHGYPAQRAFSCAVLYIGRAMTDEPKSQLDKFKEAARELECDDDERRFDERMRKIVEKKPNEDKPE